MNVSTAIRKLGPRADPADFAKLYAPPKRKGAVEDNDVIAGLITAISPKAGAVWKVLPAPLKLVAVAVAGAVAYTVYSVLKHVSSALYDALDLSIDDYSHPLLEGLLSRLGIVPSAPTSAPSAALPSLNVPEELPRLETRVQDTSVAATQEAPRAPLLSRIVDRVRGVHAGVAVGRYTPEERAILDVLVSEKANLRGGTGLTQSTKNMITRVASEERVPADHLIAMAQMESGGNPYAVSSTGAVGLFQFTGGTARGYGLTNRFDPEANTRAAARLYKDNAAYLQKKGVASTLENVYLLHQLGPRAVTLIRANRDGSDVTDPALLKAMEQNYGRLSASDYVAANKKKIGKSYDTSQRLTAPDAAYAVRGVQPVTSSTPVQARPVQQPPRATPQADTQDNQLSRAPVQSQGSQGQRTYQSSPTFFRAPNGLLLQAPG